MAMSKKKIGVIVFFIVISLTGLIILQTLLLNNAIKLKEQSFNNNVTSALNGIIENLENQQAMAVIIEVAEQQDTTAIYDSLFQTGGARTTDSFGPRIVFISGDSTQANFEDLDSTLMNEMALSVTIDSLCFKDSFLPNNIFKYKIHKGDVDDSVDCLPGQTHLLMASQSGRIDLLQRVLNRMWSSEIVPIEKRIDSSLIDSIIYLNLQKANINLNHIFGIKLTDSDSLMYATTNNYGELLNTQYRARLFPYDILKSDVELLLHFPDREVFIWKQIIPILLTISLFMIVIIISFILTIKTIMEQKRNSALMTDFVNNMTHEFKTPISTISLAAEAILRPDVITDNEKVTQYSKMIQDENIRMRRQAEKILQMATLEEGDFRLKLDQHDLHKIIEDVVDTYSLLIAQKEGSIQTSLRADKHIIYADKLHMTGILSNLLDNSSKYTSDNPQIKVETYNVTEGIYVRITDNGIGIKEDDLKMVFNKYYRVSSGNLHDVKGFGLGLSYVKLMVGAHGGTINITSQLQKGTQIEIFLPIKPGDNS
jgi:two-component system phosphate regulon sensor histidine kinase PhoR